MDSQAIDRLFSGVIWSAVALLTCIFLILLGDLVWQGFSHLSWSFLLIEPTNAGRSGGIAPILLSTLLILLVALAAAFPLGLGASA
ncbi:hypothetical protein M5G27_25225 [Pseudomonas shahriarae]|jgi:phosphate transport system permease protein|uniref:Phosphate ABC transporter permease subunit PstC n=1 Tax=Pseudomonas shahriarae TaxID=2745512 RepID=A0A9X4C5U0_9PSED|nr:hypothetical protein [Pseudomonas shahriarae]MDD1010783.1 hypothetical protein [Pseudomonas shahriarae]